MSCKGFDEITGFTLNFRIALGLALILVSYIIGWPAVFFLGFLSVYLNEPAVGLVGGPLVYGFSHLVFLAGVFLVGSKIYEFCRDQARQAFSRLFRQKGDAGK